MCSKINSLLKIVGKIWSLSREERLRITIKVTMEYWLWHRRLVTVGCGIVWISIMKIIKKVVNLILTYFKIHRTYFIINKDWCKSLHRNKNEICFNHHSFSTVFIFLNWKNLSLILWRNNFYMKLRKYLLSYPLNLKENISL